MDCAPLKTYLWIYIFGLNQDLARKWRFIQASTAQKPTIDHNTNFSTFKSLNMNSSNTAEDRTLTSHDYELDIPVVAEVVGAFKTDEQIPNQLPAPLVEVFTTTLSNVLEWLVA